MAIRGAGMADLESVADIRRISPRRFIVGGAAMLVALKINHHIVIVGRRERSPFVKNSLRVLVDSWVMAARANRAGEQRP
jgi:hypothetical protein